MKETIIAKYTATKTDARLVKEYGKGATITVTAQASQLGGNQHPHFSVTADVVTIASRCRNDIQAGGCLHDDVLRFWPNLKPLVDLHLSNSDDGEPMHGSANGLYWLAGAVPGNLGQQYHGGNAEQHFPLPEDRRDPAKPWQTTEYRRPDQEECLAILERHLRISNEEARHLRDQAVSAFNIAADGVAPNPDFEPISGTARVERNKAGARAAAVAVAKFCDTLRPRWKAEAEAGVKLIQELNAKQEATRAAGRSSVTA